MLPNLTIAIGLVRAALVRALEARADRRARKLRALERRLDWLEIRTTVLEAQLTARVWQLEEDLEDERETLARTREQARPRIDLDTDTEN
jgi:hypothetical protein